MSSLSAAGSSQKPKREAKPQRRAIKPSARSLNPAKANTARSAGIVPAEDEPSGERALQAAAKLKGCWEDGAASYLPRSASGGRQDPSAVTAGEHQPLGDHRVAQLLGTAEIGNHDLLLADIHRYHIDRGDIVNTGERGLDRPPLRERADADVGDKVALEAEIDH